VELKREASTLLTRRASMHSSTVSLQMQVPWVPIRATPSKAMPTMSVVQAGTPMSEVQQASLQAARLMQYRRQLAPPKRPQNILPTTHEYTLKRECAAHRQPASGQFLSQCEEFRWLHRKP